MRRAQGRERRLAVLALVAGLIVAGCQRAAPPISATRVAEIPEANTPGSYMDAVALAADGSRVATGERGGAIKVWTADSAPQGVALGAYRQGIADLAFSPDGSLLATIGRHRESTLRFWQDDRAGGWKEVAAIPIGRCLFLRFDAAGALLGVACETDVMVLEVATRRMAASLTNPHPEALTAFDLSADGRRVVTGGHEGGVAVWELAGGSAVRTFSVRRSRRKYGPPKGMEADTAWAVAAALSADGKRAAVATIEGSVFVWDLDTGAELLADVDNEATGPPHGGLRFTAEPHRRGRQAVAARDVARKGLPRDLGGRRRLALRGAHLDVGRAPALLHRGRLAPPPAPPACPLTAATRAAAAQPLIEPAVRPCTMYFWKNSTRSTAGRAPRKPEAAITE